MKLTGELKEKVEQAKSKEDAHIILQEAGMILTDDELEMVSGIIHKRKNVNLE